MAKYQAYAEYKDSGVEWLGDVPEHWKTTLLKRYCYVKGGYAFSSDIFKNSGKPVIRIGDIQADGSISLDKCKFISEKIAKKSQSYIITNGDLLMAMTGATIGKAGFYTSNQQAYLNQRVGRFVVNSNKLNYQFLWYTLKTNGYQEYIEITAFGGAQPNISDIGMVNYEASLPSISEQTQIANFLDYETAKIDNLIAKQKKLIELLKEKRQAVISHAVTKGLDPNVKMKASGVEWLGDVPEHWKLQKLKFLGEAIIGLTYSPDDVVNEGQGILVLRSSNIQDKKLDFKDNVFVKKKIPEKLKVRKNDILICARNGSRALIGKNTLIDESAVGLTFGAFMSIFRSPCNLYLSKVFNSSLFEYQSGSFLTATINQLTTANLNNFEIPFPSAKEQTQIANFLDNHTQKIDNLISKAETAIKLMQERRTALISSAVTGKIDVRNWQHPTQKQQEA